MLLLVPMVMAVSVPVPCNYGEGPYGIGVYGIGNCFTEEKDKPEAGAEAGAGVFASQVAVPSPLYDLVVSMFRKIFLPEETINVKITVINKAGVPVKDAMMNYYLLSPDDEKIGETLEIFLPEAGSEHTFERELQLPQNTQPGQWKFVVDFNPVEIEPLQAYISFEVVTKKTVVQIGMIMLVVVVAGLYFTGAFEKKKEKNEQFNRSRNG